MPSSDHASEGRPDLLAEKVNDTSALIDEALALLTNFTKLSEKPGDAGWEMVAQLQDVLDRMREIWPARTFMPRGVNPKTLSK